MPISIGIPFYNAEPYLADAIRSVFAQTYQDWELILLNDGSTDRSLEIAYAVNDPRIRVISDGENRRLPHRLNQIALLAKFNLVARMDADDLMSPNRLQKQLQIFEKFPQIDLVTTGMCSLSNDNVPIGIRVGSPSHPVNGQNIILNRCGIIHAAILGRKKWFLRNKYNECLTNTEDYELWLRAYKNGDFKIRVLDEPLYYYREEGNVTSLKLLKTYESHRELFKTYGSLGFSKNGVRLLTARSHCKSMLVHLLHKTNSLQILLKRRNASISEKSLLDHFNKEIAQILSTELPRF